jgi:hypothetical protein
MWNRGQSRGLTTARQRESNQQICEAMAGAGVDPALIYAFLKTGRLLTTQNLDCLSPSELAEWDLAIEEYGTSSRWIQ